MPSGHMESCPCLIKLPIMRDYIHDNFLLQNPTAVRLYHEYASEEPIFDYHCHLHPKDLAENRQFKNLFEICL